MEENQEKENKETQKRILKWIKTKLKQSMQIKDNYEIK